jgi:hypothetical protein
MGSHEGLRPVDDQSVRIRRGSGLHHLDLARVEVGQIRVLVQVQRENEILSGKRGAIVPLDVGAQLPGDVHGAVRVQLPQAVLKRGDLRGQPGGDRTVGLRLHEMIIGEGAALAAAAAAAAPGPKVREAGELGGTAQGERLDPARLGGLELRSSGG